MFRKKPKPPKFTLAGAAAGRAPLDVGDEFRRIAYDEDYSRGFKLSAVAHVAAILAVVIKTVVFPGKSLPYVPTLRVDMVGLPDLLKKDLKSPSKTSSGKEIADALKRAEREAKKIKPLAPLKSVAPPSDEMTLKPEKKSDSASREKKLKSALARIKALNKISAEENPAPAPIIKGNQVSPGSSLSGDAKEAKEASYTDTVRDRLHDNWALPVLLIRQDLSARVRVFIDTYGRVSRYYFTKGSGNPKFDEEVKRTILESQPFPRPPAEVAEEMLTSGIEFGFPL